MSIFLICGGMEISASTLVFQMAKEVLVYPPNKTHVYVAGNARMLYTFRHPLEAYVSLTRCFSEIYPTSIAKSYALERLEIQKVVYSSLQEDQKHGRSVLFMKYEDYYDDTRERLAVITEFLGVHMTTEQIAEILEKTSIESNMRRSTLVSGNFGNHDEETGLHGGHVDPVNKGMPGGLLVNIPEELRKNEKLIGLCKFFGYRE